MLTTILSVVIAVLVLVITIGGLYVRNLLNERPKPNEETVRQLKAALLLKEKQVNQMAQFAQEQIDILAKFGLFKLWLAADRLYTASEKAMLEGDLDKALTRLTEANAAANEVTAKVCQVAEANAIEPDFDGEEEAMQRLRNMVP